jgi:hypothetical protein
MKNKLSLILLTLSTLLVFSALKASAQTRVVGVTGGATWANVSSDFAAKADHRLGITGGITYEHYLGQRFSVGAEAVYNQRGYAFSTGTPTGEKVTTKYRNNYLSIPVKVGFSNLNKEAKIFSFVKVGAIPSLLLNAKVTTSTFDADGRISGATTAYVTDRASKVDLAGLAEIGGGYRVADRLWLTVSLAYQHSFTSISSAAYFEDIRIKHRGASLNAELKWALKKD